MSFRAKRSVCRVRSDSPFTLCIIISLRWFERVSTHVSKTFFISPLFLLARVWGAELDCTVNHPMAGKQTTWAHNMEKQEFSQTGDRALAYTASIPRPAASFQLITSSSPCVETPERQGWDVYPHTSLKRSSRTSTNERLQYVGVCMWNITLRDIINTYRD